MRDELAERLLSRVMGWESTQVQEFIPDLQALAQMKYDEYGNYGPGVKFVENLATWLRQFPEEKREVALAFVLEELVFISDSEMSHLVTLVPLEIIAPVIRGRIASDADIPPFRIGEIEGRTEFRELMRSSLIIGASDGARLGELRRASATLSHEQFIQGTEPDLEQLRRLSEELAAVLAEASEDSEAAIDTDAIGEGKDAEGDLEDEKPRLPFRHVFFVDDFSGSGQTLIRRKDEASPWKGKMEKLRNHLSKAAEKGYVKENVPGTVVLYCASEKARRHVTSSLEEAGFDNWSVEVVAELPSASCVDATNAGMCELCEEFVDPTTEDEHKGLAPLGYEGGALPLVLSHNTPNNSICLLWMDTRDKADPESTNLRALFPRYERHHEDRR